MVRSLSVKDLGETTLSQFGELYPEQIDDHLKRKSPEDDTSKQKISSLTWGLWGSQIELKPIHDINQVDRDF